MWFKLYNGGGEYEDVTTKEIKNLVCAINWVYTPEGLNVGWDEFSTEEEAMIHFNVQKKIKVDDNKI